MTPLARLVVLLGLLPVVTSGRVSSARQVLEPAVMLEDFDGDGLGQFASYPPAQDIGYDPSLSPTAEFEAPGGRALMRIVRPTARGPLRIGFIRQVALVMSEDAALSFRYRLEAPGARASIEVGLAGGNGTRYVGRLDAASGGWKAAEFRLSSLQPQGGTGRIPADTGIEAVYVIADVTDADPAVTYRFLIDDIRLNGRREARFELLEPKARAVPAGLALTAERGFARGETIRIEAAEPVPLVSVECTLLGPGGTEILRGALHDDGSAGDSQAKDGRWTNRQLRAIRESDPRGAWTAVLDGRAADGRRVLTHVRFLVGDAQPQEHPRLYFNAADRLQLIERTRHPDMAKQWQRIAEAAKTSRASGPIAHGGEAFERLGREHLLPTLLGYFDVLNRARTRIANNALVAWIEDDQEALVAAKAAMLDVAGWDRWAPPWFDAHGQHTYYPAGQLASAVALGYDLLYDRLSEDERARIRHALLERSILPTWREYVVDNRAMANTSNWISHTVGGAIQAAAAIIGEGTAEEAAAVHLPLNGLLLKIEAHMAASFLPDGSYGEGISYQEFDLETLGPMLHATERALGQSYWSRTFVLRSLAYPLHTLAQPPAESLDMGDSHPPAGHGIGPIVYRSEDPVIRWYGRRFDPRTIYDFVFFNQDVRPAAPAGGGSRLFRDKGNAVFRTGWEADSAMLLFRAGSTFNHNHSDQGSFLLRNFGEILASEAGWSDYYKDPYYGSYFTQAIGHNTLLVDGHPESQVIADTRQFAALDRYPRITDYISSGFYDAVGSNLAPVYPRLSAYTRRLAFLKPDVLVVFDRVTAHQPSRYNVLLHVTDVERASTTESGGRFEGTRARLALRAFASDPIEVSLREGHIPYPVLSARTPPAVPPQPGFFDVHTTRPKTGGWIISVLAMQPNAADAETLAQAFTPVSAGGWTGVRALRAGRTDVVLFREQAGTGPLQFEGWRTDGAAFMARDGEDGSRFGVQASRIVQRDARVLLAADHAFDAAAEFGPDAILAHVRTDEPGALRFFLERPPARVVISGRDVPSGTWRHEGHTLTVPVPEGESHVAITGSRAEGRAR